MDQIILAVSLFVGMGLGYGLALYFGHRLLQSGRLHRDELKSVREEAAQKVSDADGNARRALKEAKNALKTADGKVATSWEAGRTYGYQQGVEDSNEYMDRCEAARLAAEAGHRGALEARDEALKQYNMQRTINLMLVKELEHYVQPTVARDIARRIADAAAAAHNIKPAKPAAKKQQNNSHQNGSTNEPDWPSKPPTDDDGPGDDWGNES